ncbi:hypothetical protein NUSPORA_00663 [Nucleospora cyclopteri]
MSTLENKKREVEMELDRITKTENEMRSKQSSLNKNIKNMVIKHNELIKELGKLKEAYKNQLINFSELKQMASEYKREQQYFLIKNYERRINEIVKNTQQLTFDCKMTVFNDFDALKRLDAHKFPNLDRKIQKYYDYQKEKILKHVFSQIETGMINEKIFYMTFLIKCEKYFKEAIFVEFLYKKVEQKFYYHFMSNKETARMDKSEWFFGFLEKQLNEIREQFGIYRDLREKEVMPISDGNYEDLIEKCNQLIKIKIDEILQSETAQKTSLIFHLAKEYKKYHKFIFDNFNVSISDKDVSHAVCSQQILYINSEMAKIHELRYIQWFREYQKLIKENLTFLAIFSFLDHQITLEETVELIVFHTREFLDNLRYVNREEIKVICFIFSEVEDLKEFIENEEMDLLINFTVDEKELLGRSIEMLSNLNSEILDLIRNLAENDVKVLLRRIASYNYTTPESKKNFLIGLNKCTEEYKLCTQYKVLEQQMVSDVDNFIMDSIILQYKLQSEDYLEFRDFFKSIKRIFGNYEWETERGIKVLDAIFEGKKIPSKLFDQINAMYNN